MFATMSRLLLPLAALLAVACASGTDAPSATADGGLNGLFHDTSEATGELRDLALRFPSWATVGSIGRSIEGREIPSLRVHDASMPQAPLNIYVLGGHHAGEWMGVEVALSFPRYLLERAGTDAGARRVIREAQVYVVPIVNPDGLEYTIHTSQSWRKNRRDNGNGLRGVDLNRNYEFMWGCDDVNSSPNPASHAYRGTAPFSEPETQAIRELMLSNPPAGVLDFHTFGQIVYPPRSLASVLTPRHLAMRDLARRMTDIMAATNGRSYDVGPSYAPDDCPNGKLIHWAYATYAAPSFLVELPGKTENDAAESDIAGITGEQAPAILHFMNAVIDGLPL
jgi:carboxypeptidase T